MAICAKKVSRDDVVVLTTSSQGDHGGSVPLARVKDDLPLLIADHVHAALSREQGFVWRDRKLNPLTTLLLFMAQVMHGNTAMTHLRHLWPVQFTATAYCKARRRLPVDRISFIDALRWLRDARGQDAVTLIVNPKRTGCIEPRAIKRRPRGYPLMSRPRSELRQAWINKRAAA